MGIQEHACVIPLLSRIKCKLWNSWLTGYSPRAAFCPSCQWEVEAELGDAGKLLWSLAGETHSRLVWPFPLDEASPCPR